MYKIQWMCLLNEKWFKWGEGFVLVYSVASKESFEEMKVYFSTLVKTKKAKPPVVVVGTQGLFPKCFRLTFLNS